MTDKTAILWFRQDLRLKDNPALNHAARHYDLIIPIFILDDAEAGPWKRGAASRWWLHESLKRLNTSLDGKMVFYAGNAQDILEKLIETTKARAVFWNRCYEPWRKTRDKKIKEALKARNIDAQSFNASLLWEPWEVKKSDGSPYKVFTPYFRKGCLSLPEPPRPENAPAQANFRPSPDKTSPKDLRLMQKIKWKTEMETLWTPGETGARAR